MVKIMERIIILIIPLSNLGHKISKHTLRNLQLIKILPLIEQAPNYPHLLLLFKLKHIKIPQRQ